MANKPLTGLAARLLADQIMGESAIHQAQAAAIREQKPLARYLLENNLVNAKELMQATGEELGLPTLDLAAFDPEYVVRDVAPEKLIPKTQTY